MGISVYRQSSLKTNTFLETLVLSTASILTVFSWVLHRRRRICCVDYSVFHITLIRPAFQIGDASVSQ